MRMRHPAGKCLEIVILIGVACAGFGATATRPSQDSSQTLAQFVAENERIVGQWRALPLLAARSITDVVRFKEEQGLLVAGWPILNSGPVTGRFSLTDLPGTARLMCSAPLKQTGQLFPMFEYYDLTQSDGMCRHLQVLSSQTRLMLVQDSESVNSYKSVSLIESVDQTDQTPVMLRVQTLEDFKPELNLAISAATLDELRREHAGEFEQYLRPMFREFHQEQAVFAVEDRIAWQVLGGDWTPTNDLPGRVMDVVARLNSSDFGQRQSAERELHSLGEPAALYLRKMDRGKLTPEQSARIETFLAGYFPLTNEQAKKLGKDVNFLLDCLANDDRALRMAALNRLNEVLGRAIEYKIDQPQTDREPAIDQLRRQWAPALSKPQAGK